MTAELDDPITDAPSTILGRADEELFVDPAFLRSALDSIQPRIDVFEEAVQLMNRLPWNRETIILCDWDVLRATIVKDAANRSEPFPLRYFFTEGQFKYTLPEGAYKELMKWLAAELNVSNELSQKAALKDNLFESLSILLGLLTDEPGLDLRAIASAMARQNARHITALHLERFLQHLENERFVPEIALEMGEAELRFAVQAVTMHRRYVRVDGKPEIDLRSREERDKSDSANLAIALTRAVRVKREKEEAQREPYFLLMTNTALVRDAANELRGLSLRQALCAHPETIVILDMLGFSKEPAKAHSLGSDFLNQLTALNQNLSRQLADVQASGPDDTSVRRVPRIRRILESIQHGESPVQRLLKPEMLSLEFLSSNVIATTANQELQKGVRPIAPYDTSVGGFLQLLDRLSHALGHTKNVNYSVNPGHDKRTAYDTVTIDLDRSGASDLFRLAFNRFYGPKGQPLYWRAEFVHQKKELDFVRFLTATLPHDNVFPYTIKEYDRFPEIALVDRLPPSTNPVHGAIVSTGAGAIWISPKVIAKRGWGTLRLFDLQAMLRAIPFNLDGESVPEIRAIRVNTLVCDVVFEALPDDGDVFSTVTILSHLRVPLLVVKAVDHLAPRLILEERLLHAVREVLPSGLQESTIVK